MGSSHDRDPEQGVLAQHVRQGRRRARRRLQPRRRRRSPARRAPRGPTSAGYLPDATQVDSYLTINADNTVDVQDEPDRDRQRHHDRPDDARRRGARRRREPGAPQRLGQLAGRQHRLDRRQHRHPVERRPAAPRGRRDGQAGAARPRLDEPRRAGREPHASRTAWSRAAARPSPTASSSAASCFNTKLVAPTLNPGVAPSKPVSQYKVITHAGAAGRGAGQDLRQVHLRPQRPDPRHAARHASCGRAGRGRSARVLRSSRSTRARSAHIPGARVVRQGDFLAVVAPKEYDAIQAAAQLKVTWKESPMLSSSGNLFSKMRADDTRRQRQGGVPHEHRQRRHRARSRRRRRSRRRYQYHYGVARRDRPVVRRCGRARRLGDDLLEQPERARRRHRGRRHARARRPRTCARTTTRARARSARARARRSPPRRRRSRRSWRACRCACSSCAGTRPAGTTSRPRRSTTRGPGWMRAGSSSRTTSRCSSSRTRPRSTSRRS